MTSVWDPADWIHIHDFRIYQGSYFTLRQNTKPLLGCQLTVSAYYSQCLICDDQSTNSKYLPCQQAATYGYLNQNVYCPWSNIYTPNGVPACSYGGTDGCALHLNGGGCSVCYPPKTVDNNRNCSYPNTAYDEVSSDMPMVGAPNICGQGTVLCTLVNGELDTILKCKQGYYYDNSSTPVQCSQCDASCLTCNNGSMCETCPPSQYLQPGTGNCGTTCGDGYLMDYVNQKCVSECDVGLLMVNDTTNSVFQCDVSCPSVPVNYIPSGSQCVTDCPAFTFKNISRCQPCASQCESCYGPLNIQCYSCQPSFYLEVTKCDSSCLNSSLYMDDTTLTCIESCPDGSLVVQDQMRCMKNCPTTPILYYQYQTQCFQQCPISAYSQLDSNTNFWICSDCDPSCNTCSGGAPTQCITCNQGYYLDGTSCPNECTNTSQPWADNVNNVCQISCPKNSIIFADNQSCVASCPQSLAIKYYSYKGECLQKCPNGAFPYGSTCITCNPACTTCFGGMATQCTVCSPNYYLYINTCYQTCPKIKRYADNSTKNCTDTCSFGQLTIPELNQCLSSCPTDFVLDLTGRQCLSSCPIGQYASSLQQCQKCDPACTSCSDGTRRQCGGCTENFFLDGTVCDDISCVVHPNYLKVDYLWICADSCPSGMYESIDLGTCVNVCAAYLFVFNMKCYGNCLDGYYGDTNSMTCQQCTKECTICSDGTSNNCQNCSKGYYLELTSCTLYCSSNYYKDETSFQCLTSCPVNTLYYSDGAGSKSCVKQCPTGQYKHTDSTCYAICPDGYFGNPLDGLCDKCSLECSTCNAAGNSACLTCSPTFNRLGSACVGPCPEGYFPQATGCQSCAFRCQTCDTNQYNCLRCKGDRINLPVCQCDEGYFDDGLSENCQQCIAPCITCSSLTFCLTCPFNTAPPSCKCLRNPPVKSDWCVSCFVAFPNIRFSDDLNDLIIDFGYEITINSVDPYVASKDNCIAIFQNETLNKLGHIPQCKILKNSPTFIQVIFDYGVTIMVGDTLLFNQNAISDQSLDSCKSQYISMFMTPNVSAPSHPPSPSMTFNYPAIINSLCTTAVVSIDQQSGNGPRDLNRQNWTYISRTDLITGSETLTPRQELNIKSIKEQLATFSANYSSFFILPNNILDQNSIYKFSLTYSNILGTQGTTYINLKVGTSNTASVQILVQPSIEIQNYLEYEIPLKIVSLSCQRRQNPVDTGEKYSVNLNVMDLVTGSVIMNQDEIDSGTRSVIFTIPAYATTPGNQIQVNATIVSKQDTSKKGKDSVILNIMDTKIDAFFLTTDRVVGANNTKVALKVEAFDPGVSNKQFSRTGIDFRWQCVDLSIQQSCKDSQSILIEFPNANSIIMPMMYMQVNHTYIFYINITKGSYSILLSQQIVIVQDFVPELYFRTSQSNQVSMVVRPYDKLTVIYNPPVKKYSSYVLMLYDYVVKDFHPVDQSTYEFQIQKFESEFTGSSIINLFFTGFKDYRRIQVDIPSNQFQFEITQSTKEIICLQTRLTIALKPLDSKINQKGYKFQFFYYLDEIQYQNDKSSYTTDNAFILTGMSQISFVTTVLPAPVSSQFILLAKIQGPTGSYVFLSKKFQVTCPSVINQRKNLVPISKFISGLKHASIVNQLMTVALAVSQLKSRDLLACPTCGGKGVCIKETQTCMCDQDWYLSDCSGGVNDLNTVTSLTKTMITQLYQLGQSTIITKNTYYMQILTQTQGLLYDSPYFYNSIGQVNDFDKILLSIIAFVEDQVQVYQLNNNKTKRNYQDQMNFAQNPTISGLNVYVSNYSILPTQSLNSLIQIITSVFQQNAQQYLSTSALSALAGKTNNQTKEQMSETLQKVNSQIFNIINQLLDLSSTQLSIGLQVTQIKSSTIDIQMRRDFWSQMKQMHNNNVIGSHEKLVGIEDLNQGQTNSTSQNSTTQNNSNQSSSSSNTSAANQTSNSSTNNTIQVSANSTQKSNNNISNNSTRRLLGNLESTTLYDYKLTKYAMNPFRLADDFPYPNSAFPVYHLQISDVKHGLELRSLMTNYTFNISQNQIDEISGLRQYNSSIVVYNEADLLQFAHFTEIENYVCVFYNQSKSNWSLCENFTVTNATTEFTNNRSINCSCSQLAPVTAFNDYLYAYKPKIVRSLWVLDQQNLYVAVISLTIFWFLTTICGLWRDKKMHDIIIPQLSGFANMLAIKKDEDGIIEKQEQVTSLARTTKGKERTALFIEKSGNQSNQNDDSVNEDVARQMANKLYSAKKKVEEANLINVWGAAGVSPMETSKPSMELSGLDKSGYGSPSQRIRNNDLSSDQKFSAQQPENKQQVKPVPVVAMARVSKHSCSQFHRNHSLLSICFRFQKDVGRGFRFTFFYCRLLMMFCIGGLLASVGVSIGMLIAFQIITSSIYRLMLFPMRSSLIRARDPKDPSCCFAFVVYLLTASSLATSSIILIVLYFNLPATANDPTLYSWIYSIVLDQTALEISIELFYRTADWVKKLAKEHAERADAEDSEEADEEEEQENIVIK